MKIAIIGRTEILFNTAQALVKKGHEIGCIITAPAAPEYTRTEADFELLSHELGCPFLLTKTLDDPNVEVLCNDLDIGVSVNWVSVIRDRHIDLFRLGVLNSHNGDLPQYRGNACSNWAILRGERKITNTIHFMEGDRLDCGRVIHQESMDLDNNTSIIDVSRWNETTIPSAYVSAIEKLERDPEYIEKYADPSAVNSFRCYPRLPEDGFISWDDSAAAIHNLIRAAGRPFAGAYTYCLENDAVRKLIVWNSRVVEAESKDLAVPGHVISNDRESGESRINCGKGVLALLTCRYEGEENDFQPGLRWKSIRKRLGVRSEDWLWYLTGKIKDS